MVNIMLAVPGYEVRPQNPSRKLTVVPSAGENVQKKLGGLLDKAANPGKGETLSISNTKVENDGGRGPTATSGLHV